MSKNVVINDCTWQPWDDLNDPTECMTTDEYIEYVATEEAKMRFVFPKTLDEAFAQITPDACKAVLAQGVNFAVACETQAGKWFVLHATDMDHAWTLARSRVDHFLCRGASIWRIHPDGLASKKCGAVYEEVWNND
jgi:hypothetical protein